MQRDNSYYPRTRSRRLRKNSKIRKLISENRLEVSDLIWPIFICEGDNVREPISSMEGVYRLSIDNLLKDAQYAHSLGISCVALFPSINANLKTMDCKEAINPDNLINTATKVLKNKCPELLIMLDVALDPFNASGHDGLFDGNRILNDETVDMLAQQAIIQARSGADILGPSDMMDGSVGKIRDTLENEGFFETLIMAYSAKYASSLYAPFRDALKAKSKLVGDKKTYQMDLSNSDEAMRNTYRDLNEGADMVMVKPGAPYLDICYRIKTTFGVPTFSYQVSGEYSMIMGAIKNGWLDEDTAIFESLMCFKRAGCDGILTYFAPKAAVLLSK
ncbi:MAG: porphobilinogen synthase [Paracoccaceae bacterium]|nr:porphobilinogen synthase [Paracoccaceae bacterium]